MGRNRKQLVVPPTPDELQEMPSLDEEIVNQATKGTISVIDDAFIVALQQIIPEATKHNIHQYAHRIVVKSKPGNAYPITAYCDGKEFFRLDEPQTGFVMNDNTATMTIKQNYWSIRLEESEEQPLA